MSVQTIEQLPDATGTLRRLVRRHDAAAHHDLASRTLANGIESVQ